MVEILSFRSSGCSGYQLFHGLVKLSLGLVCFLFRRGDEGDSSKRSDDRDGFVRCWCRSGGGGEF